MIPLTVPENSRLIAATVRTACGVVVRIAGGLDCDVCGLSLDDDAEVAAAGLQVR
jgi:hypothetical protein